MLSRLGFTNAALDAKWLAAAALGLSDLEMVTRENEPVDDAAALRLAEMVQRRMGGESVGRIIGEREFYGLPFRLNAATLEPRADTELLVDLALKIVRPGWRLLDLGTGTGCIPIAILANAPDVSALAVDISGEALLAARDNAERNGVAARLALLEGSWFEPLAEGERFELIVSNPPYIESAVIATLAPEVRVHDPLVALDGGPDGLAPYRIIAAEAGRWLKPGGQLMVEIGYDQGAAVSALFAAAGFAGIAVHRDFGGLDRVVCAHHISV